MQHGGVGGDGSVSVWWGEIKRIAFLGSGLGLGLV